MIVPCGRDGSPGRLPDWLVSIWKSRYSGRVGVGVEDCVGVVSEVGSSGLWDSGSGLCEEGLADFGELSRRGGSQELEGDVREGVDPERERWDGKSWREVEGVECVERELGELSVSRVK